MEITAIITQRFTAATSAVTKEETVVPATDGAGYKNQIARVAERGLQQTEQCFRQGELVKSLQHVRCWRNELEFVTH